MNPISVHNGDTVGVRVSKIENRASVAVSSMDHPVSPVSQCLSPLWYVCLKRRSIGHQI